MNKINFDTTKPDFVNGDFKWYIDDKLQKYIETQQADNLPKLNGIFSFVVKGNVIEDYVLIDNKQNVISGYDYSHQGYEQMIAKINIIKVFKHYDEYEKTNI